MELLFIGKLKNKASSASCYLPSNYDPDCIIIDQVYEVCTLLVSTLDEGPDKWEFREVRCMFTSNKCFVKNVDIYSHVRERSLTIKDYPPNCNLFFVMKDGMHVYCKIINEDRMGLEIKWLRYEDAVYTFLLD